MTCTTPLSVVISTSRTIDPPAIPAHVGGDRLVSDNLPAAVLLISEQFGETTP